MSKTEITVKIPEVGDVTIKGNLATEDAVQDLIKAVQGQAISAKVETDKLQDNLDDASGGLDEFSDELERSTKANNKLAKEVWELTKKTSKATGSFIKTTSRTDSMSEMVESAGEVISGLAGGLAGLVPFIGEGTARLAEAATQAGFMLLSMAVGAIEGFQALNRSIMDSGMLLDGGFSGFAAAADEAGIPIQAFGEAILANTNRLRLMAGGAPGGLARLSAGFRALREAQDENMAQLYALGFNNTEVAAGMANVAIAAERAGRNLSSEELAIETYDYMRSLRELNRLTGINAEEALAQVEANRSNLFIQNQLAALGPEQRNAANEFIAAMEQAGLGALTDFGLTGFSENVEDAMIVNGFGPLGDIMRQYFSDLRSGADPEEAMARYTESVDLNSDAINAARLANQEVLGTTRGIAAEYAAIGTASQSVAGHLQAVAQGTDPLAGLGETGRNLSTTLGEVQQAAYDSQAAIQSTFVQGLDALSGDDGALTWFAQSISGAAMGVENFRDAMLAVMRGDYEAAAGILGVESNRPRTAQQNLRDNPHSDPAVQELLQRVVNEINRIEYQEEQNDLSNMPADFQMERLTGELNQALEDLQRLVGEDQAAELMRSYDIAMPQQFAQGGIANYPETGGLATLHGTEAVVPLPDGRSIPVDFGESNTAPIEMLSGTLERTIGGYTSQFGDYTSQLSALSFESLHGELRQLGTALTDRNAPAAEQTNSASTDFSTGLDSSRTLSEMLQVNRNMLNQMISSTQKLEQMVQTMERGNTISRNTAYARA